MWFFGEKRKSNSEDTPSTSLFPSMKKCLENLTNVSNAGRIKALMVSFLEQPCFFQLTRYSQALWKEVPNFQTN
jgi:hypothetical protein